MRCFLLPRRSSSHLNKKSLAILSKGRRGLIAVPPNLSKEYKKGGTKGRILRGTTLIHLHQINSRLLNASHPGKTYFDFSHAVPERTSLFPIYRFPAFPALCEKSEIRTFFHQHFCNMCLLYRMMRKMSSRKALINQERSAGVIQRRRSAKGIPAADLLSPPKKIPDRKIRSGAYIIDSQSP